MRAQEFVKPHQMAKLEKTGRIVEILRHQDQVDFSDEPGWYLINLEPGKRVAPDMKWIPDTTRFLWVREFKRADAVAENQVENRDGIDLELVSVGKGIFQIRASSNDRDMGYVTFDTVDPKTKTVISQDLEVDERYRGQGIAAVMYDYAKELGYRIERSDAQTDAGKQFWDKNRDRKRVWEATDLEDRFKKYIKPTVKTTPKIERITNPAGRTTDHVEYKVTGPTGMVHRFKSKKEAEAHYSSFTEQEMWEDNDTDKSQAWIDKVYAQFPDWPYGQADKVMVWGEGENQTFAAFKLKPSASPDTVEIDWIMAGPEQRKGVGSRAIKELQRLAQADSIKLTLYPWSKGRISQSSLAKLYKRHGFKPIAKGAKPMTWNPARAVAEGESNDTAISLSKLGKFHPGADTLAEFVPERATAQYALHPDKWESTFYSLTNKDSDKLKYYGPKKISIPPGTLVGDMAIANKFYRAKTTEEKQQYAEAYKASLQPYPVDVSKYRMPELLIPKQGVAENFADGKGPGRPGDSVRHGIPKGATMAELERASHAKGRKGQLARWQLNMRRGKKK